MYEIFRILHQFDSEYWMTLLNIENISETSFAIAV